MEPKNEGIIGPEFFRKILGALHRICCRHSTGTWHDSVKYFQTYLQEVQAAAAVCSQFWIDQSLFRVLYNMGGQRISKADTGWMCIEYTYDPVKNYLSCKTAIPFSHKVKMIRTEVKRKAVINCLSTGVATVMQKIELYSKVCPRLRVPGKPLVASNGHC